jgi:hypothetical protein
MWFDDQCEAYPADHPGYCYCTGMAGLILRSAIVPTSLGLHRTNYAACLPIMLQLRRFITAVSSRRAARGIHHARFVDISMYLTPRGPCDLWSTFAYSNRKFAERKMTACLLL